MAKHEGKGGLWHNRYKSQGDTRPDYIGEITIDGITHKISGWINSQAGGGRPAINLVFNKEYKTPPPKPNSYAPPPEVAKAVEFDPFDDKDKDIPF